jgi:hypothetical protein
MDRLLKVLFAFGCVFLIALSVILFIDIVTDKNNNTVEVQDNCVRMPGNVYVRRCEYDNGDYCYLANSGLDCYFAESSE